MQLLTPPKDRPPTDVVAAVRGRSSRPRWRNAAYLAADWLVIAGAITAHALLGGPALYLLAVALVGTRMRALANLLHEAAHHKLFAHRSVNDMCARLLCGWPILVDYDRYARLHRLHHRSLWVDNQDPDVALYRLTRTETSSAERLTFGAFLLRHVVLVVIPVMPLRRLLAARRSQRLLVGLVLGVLVLAAGWFALRPLTTGFLLYWLVPWLTTYQICGYWAELGEHGGLRAVGHDWGSRNWRGNVLTRWAIGSHSDDLYHLLHHWFPSVPHFRLRELDRLCRSRWPEYAARARCTGFFLGGRGGVSVLRDIWTGGPRVTGPEPAGPDAIDAG
jgi:fatty acid desaturase